MTLGEHQRIFAYNVANLIFWTHEQGWEVTGGEWYRPEEMAKIYAERGIGIADSLHTMKLAIDLNLFINGKYQTESDAYQPMGEYWKTLHPNNRWGGSFKKQDGNHFEMQFQPRRAL